MPTGTLHTSNALGSNNFTPSTTSVGANGTGLVLNTTKAPMRVDIQVGGSTIRTVTLGPGDYNVFRNDNSSARDFTAFGHLTRSFQGADQGIDIASNSRGDLPVAIGSGQIGLYISSL